MNFDVPDKIIKKYDIKLLILFGSSGTEYEREDSDLDLAYLPEELLNEREESGLYQELIEFYSRDDIDLVNLYKAEPGLKLSISRQGRVIFEKNNAFAEFQLYAAGIYADTKFLRKMRERELKERVSQL
ncbi:MAG: type VII toxin-antitoxin system MntA family adenylyltransferase antitoxin [Halanaerobiaceae bacterium]